MRKKTVSLILAIVICSILSFVFFFAFNFIIRAIFEDVDNINIVIYNVNLIIYAFFYYVIHIKKRDEPFSSDDHFSFLKEAKAYLSCEGKYLFVIYAVLALVCEIEYQIPKSTPGHFICTVCSMFFPYLFWIRIPVVRSIVNLAISNLIPLLLVEFKSYRLHKKIQK